MFYFVIPGESHDSPGPFLCRLTLGHRIHLTFKLPPATYCEVLLSGFLDGFSEDSKVKFFFLAWSLTALIIAEPSVLP